MKPGQVSTVPSSAKTELRSWTSDSDCSPWAPSGVDPNSVTFGFHCTSTGSLPVFGGDNQKSSVSVITNSDTGAAVFATQVPSGCSDALYAEYFVDSQLHVYQQNTGCSDTQAHMLLTYVAQDAVTSQLDDAIVFPNNTGMFSGFWPALQREDGSYIGTDGDNHLLAVAAAGKLWQQSIAADPSTGLPTPVKPLYATADRGVIVTSTTTDGNGNTQLGNLYTVDQSGNVGSQEPDIASRMSWKGNWYAPSAAGVSSYARAPFLTALTSGAFSNGNPSTTGAFFRPWYFILIWQNDEYIRQI